MLWKFITIHRDELIARTQAKVTQGLAPQPTAQDLIGGTPLFLEHVAEALRSPSSPVPSTIGCNAAAHGAAALRLDYPIAQVVHDYGDACQAIAELADEIGLPITPQECHVLTMCLDEAIAGAVTEYTRLRERSSAETQAEHSGMFAHELRNRIGAAYLAFEAISRGRAPIGGAVAAVVTRNLRSLMTLVDQSLVDVRVDAGIVQPQRVHLVEVIEEALADGSLDARMRGVSLNVAPLDREVDVVADAQVLRGAINNLLQNAFKFTRVGGNVSLRTCNMGAQVAIEIEDECGGLPPGKVEELFAAFQQRGADRSGLGLGLLVSRRGVEASGGAIRVRDLPGSGCIFAIELPRLQPS